MKTKLIKNVFVGLIILIILSTIGIAQEKGKYGGIASSVNNTPNGTIIDVNLSEYYKTPTATGDGHTYWFIGGWGWFNESEMMKLPSNTLMYDMSPYDCSSDNSCGSSSVYVVPISFVVIVAFIVFVIYTSRKKR